MPGLALVIPVEPHAMGRPRFGRGRTYQDPATAIAKKQIQYWMLKSRMDIRRVMPFPGPLHIGIGFYFEKAKRQTKGCEEYPCKSPDLSAYVEMIMDSGNEILWKDKSQIVSMNAFKEYGKPRTVIQIGDPYADD